MPGLREGGAEVCTEWECDFLESVNEQMARRRDMSPKQLDIIDRIYDKVCRSNY